MNFLEKLDSGIKSHHGLMREIAKESGKTERWLRMVLNGERKDSGLVLLAARMFADKEDKVREDMQQAEELENAVAPEEGGEVPAEGA